MSGSAYGSPMILANGTAIDVSMRGYDKLSSTFEAEKKDLETVDTDLHNLWLGTAGNSFYNASYTAEKNMENLITKYKNFNITLNETKDSFGTTDNTLAGNLTVDPLSASTQSGG